MLDQAEPAASIERYAMFIDGEEVQDASGRTIETTTVNVSAGGALVEGGFFGPRDAAVEVSIKLPNGAEVNARGLIVRILPQGTALRFTDLDPSARSHLDSMVLSVRAALARRFAEKAARDEAARAGRRA